MSLPNEEIEKDVDLVIEEAELIELEVEEPDEIELQFSEDFIKVPTGDYSYLTNKPSINEVSLEGDKSLEELGVQPAGTYPDHELTNREIEELLNSAV